MNDNLNSVLSITLQMRLRQMIVRECRISRATLSNWLTGKTPIPFWAKEKIDTIIQQELGRTVFTDQETLTDFIA